MKLQHLTNCLSVIHCHTCILPHDFIFYTTVMFFFRFQWTQLLYIWFLKSTDVTVISIATYV